MFESVIISFQGPEVTTYHRNCLRAQDFRYGQGCVERHVGQDVDDGDQGAGDGDGTRQVLDGILELLDDEVQVVPAIVGEQSRVEGQRDLGHVGLGVVPGEIFHFA